MDSLSSHTLHPTVMMMENVTYLASFIVQFYSNLNSIRVDFNDILEVRIDDAYSLEAKLDIFNRRETTFGKGSAVFGPQSSRTGLRPFSSSGRNICGILCCEESRSG